MGILHELLVGDYRKPTAISHIKHPLSPCTLPILEIACAIVQLTLPRKDGLYVFPKRLCKYLLGWEKSNNFSPSRSFMELYENDIHWNILNEDGAIEPCQSRFLTDIGGHKTNSKNIYFGVHPKIEKILKDPEQFARPDIIMIFALARYKGAYGLYSVLMDAICRGKEFIDISLSHLKNIFAIAEDKYPIFRDFNKRSLSIKVKQLNSISNIAITYKTYREERKIVGVRFWSQLKPWQQSLLFSTISDIESVLNEAGIDIDKTMMIVEGRYGKIIGELDRSSFPPFWLKAGEEGLSLKQIKTFCSSGEYTEKIVLKIIEKIKEYKATTTVRNPRGLCNQAFNEKWGIEELEGEKQEKERILKAKQKEKEQKRVETEKKVKAEIERKKRSEKIHKILSTKTEDEISVLIGEFRKTLAPFLLTSFDDKERGGVASIKFKEIYYDFLATKFEI